MSSGMNDNKDEAKLLGYYMSQGSPEKIRLIAYVHMERSDNTCKN